MYSYWFKRSKRNAPEIPGNIIAHMATTPEEEIMGRE
jgi:hypothetical protein